MKSVFASCLLLVSASSLAEPPSPATSREIAALFAVLENSDCKFNRNGTWHAAKQAADHLRMKHEYLLKKDLVTTTESFIERAATSSSMSGKPYLVKCIADASVESKSWFTTQLRQLRESPRKH